LHRDDDEDDDDQDAENYEYEIDTPPVEFKFLKRLGLKHDLRTDESGAILTADFDRSVKYLFQDFSENENSKEPFSNTVRILLVDNILKYFSFSLNSKERKNLERYDKSNDMFEDFKIFKKKSKKEFTGLPFMLNEDYFDDAFVLHDRTNHLLTIGELIQHVNQTAIMNESGHAVYSDSLKIDRDKKDEFFDYRKVLNDKWARLSNFFRFQPLSLIRGYFGEMFALYFAWVGHFIFCLYFPTFVGILFFCIGIASA
jgi:hypothetical protein